MKKQEDYNKQEGIKKQVIRVKVMKNGLVKKEVINILGDIVTTTSKTDKNVDTQLIQIGSGFMNSVFKTKKTEEISKKRMAICQSCNLLKKVPNLLNSSVSHYCNRDKEGEAVKDVRGRKRLLANKGDIVKGCGCNLDAKTRSLGSQCPLGKWSAEDH